MKLRGLLIAATALLMPAAALAAPGVVTTGIGWWRPEATGPEFAALDINVNAALTYGGPMDPMSGSVDTRALPCRLHVA